MHSTTPGEPSDDDDLSRDTNLNLLAAKMDVCRHERLAYTEPPRRSPVLRPKSERTKAVLAAMSHWALAHL